MINPLTFANTFGEHLLTTQQLVSLMNALTDGAQFNANTRLVLSSLVVSNLTLSGTGTLANVNTAIIPEGGANLYFSNTRSRSAFSNTTPITFDVTNGIFGHATSGVTATGYGDSVTIPVLVIGAHGHVSSAVNTAIRLSSTSQTGIVQLSDSLFSNFSNVAATSNAVAQCIGYTASVDASLKSLGRQDANNANISNGTISGVVLNAQRVAEQYNTYTPVLNANVVLNWGNGASIVTTNGNNLVTFANVPTTLAVGHSVYFSNLNQCYFQANVQFGVGGKRSVNGDAIVSLLSLVPGGNIYATIMWSSV